MPDLTQNLEWTDLDRRAVDTARVLAADAVEKVGNGHPGTAMSLAPVAHLLFQKVMRHDPADDRWTGRDRFILSPGHTSLTLYAQLYLSGYGLELEDLKSLRTWGSLTPGHPEYRHTKGIEITTGPLGQGLASAVGFAYAQRYMRGLFDPDAPQGKSPFDHTIYTIASDGDLQEGVTSEASSLAGHQQLGNLVVIYDQNQISIEDDTDVAFTEDVLTRYEAYGWDVRSVDWTRGGEYREDVEELYEQIRQGKAETSKPTLIALRTVIGWPAPKKQNTGGIHGSKLGGEELAAVKKILGFDPEQTFEVEQEVVEHTRQVVQRSQRERAEWQRAFDSWREQEPERAELFDRLSEGRLPEGCEQSFPTFTPGESVATRAASGTVINAIAETFPELWGGSADLAGSNNTTIESADSFNPVSRSTAKFSASPYGRVLHFGIREHAAAAIVNGIVLSSPTRAFSGTFLIFSDYQRPAIRLAALMGVPSIFVWTHDSIGLGEDGPTHQPVEQLAALRAVPGFDVVRPADANETAAAWRRILEESERPSGIVLTRQNVPTLAREDLEGGEGEKYASAQNAVKGGYILADAEQTPEVLLIATGSEVHLALQARTALAEEGISARVISMPSREWFDRQPREYRDSVLPPQIRARVTVEAGLSMPWRDLLGDHGRAVSLEHFGASADYQTLYQEFGITADAVVQAARDSLASLR